MCNDTHTFVNFLKLAPEYLFFQQELQNLVVSDIKTLTATRLIVTRSNSAKSMHGKHHKLGVLCYWSVIILLMFMALELVRWRPFFVGYIILAKR